MDYEYDYEDKSYRARLNAKDNVNCTNAACVKNVLRNLTECEHKHITIYNNLCAEPYKNVMLDVPPGKGSLISSCIFTKTVHYPSVGCSRSQMSVRCESPAEGKAACEQGQGAAFRPPNSLRTVNSPEPSGFSPLPSLHLFCRVVREDHVQFILRRHNYPRAFLLLLYLSH